MTDLEAARMHLSATDPLDEMAMRRAQIAVAVQERIAEDVAEHEARQALHWRKA